MNLWSYIFFQLLPDYLPRIILSGAIVFVILCKPGIMKKVYKKMGHSQKTNILYRIIFAVLIFVVIREQSDYIYVIALNSCGYIAAGFLNKQF